MNTKRMILAAMAVVAVVSFVDPVAAQSTLQAATASWFGDAFNWVADNSERIITVVETVVEAGQIIGIW
ncbi:MAG: hypothetical protein J07HB67_01449 [halophilic archaeon J07HB67]|nr:MAG: hypothetical protein J07HB67_01449 [halophilic archaeon J07HB67]